MRSEVASNRHGGADRAASLQRGTDISPTPEPDLGSCDINGITRRKASCPGSRFGDLETFEMKDNKCGLTVPRAEQDIEEMFADMSEMDWTEDEKTPPVTPVPKPAKAPFGTELTKEEFLSDSNRVLDRFYKYKQSIKPVRNTVRLPSHTNGEYRKTYWPMISRLRRGRNVLRVRKLFQHRKRLVKEVQRLISDTGKGRRVTLQLVQKYLFSHVFQLLSKPPKYVAGYLAALGANLFQVSLRVSVRALRWLWHRVSYSINSISELRELEELKSEILRARDLVSNQMLIVLAESSPDGGICTSYSACNLARWRGRNGQIHAH